MTIIEELGELVESTKYPWWKNTNDDVINYTPEKIIKDLYSNFYIELVDLLHFIITADIRDFVWYKMDRQNDDVTDFNNVLAQIMSYMKSNPVQLDFYLDKSDIKNLWTIILDFDARLKQRIINREVLYVYEFLRFINKLSQLIDISFEDLFIHLYNIYVSKYALNMFRQDMGYNKGQYKKIWKDGREDNYHLMEYLKSKNGREVTYDEVYNFLKQKYNEINKTE